MQALELYRKLPRQNCGRCSRRTCMPFALAVLAGEADLADCPLLAEEARKEIAATLTSSDWREGLIASLRREIAGIDLARIASDIGARTGDGGIVLRCLGRDFRVSADGEITTEGRITPWTRILILHYIRTAGSGELAGSWVSFGELKGGMVKASSFERECVEPLLALMQSGRDAVADALAVLDAERRDDLSSPDAWVLPLLPKLPAAILFWPPDDEFPARLRILFDATASRFLDVESLIFLTEGLVSNVEALLRR